MLPVATLCQIARKGLNPRPYRHISPPSSSRRLIWYFYPQDERVEVYAHGEHIRTATIDDTLNGRDTFPGLTIHVRDIFV